MYSIFIKIYASFSRIIDRIDYAVCTSGGDWIDSAASIAEASDVLLLVRGELVDSVFSSGAGVGGVGFHSVSTERTCKMSCFTRSIITVAEKEWMQR